MSEPISQKPPPDDSEVKLKIYFLPNLLTAGNLFCGFIALTKIVEADPMSDNYFAQIKLSLAFILLACIFDLFDGRVARMGGVESPFGREFDSLADLVSFGVAPAAMAFAAGMRGGWDALFLIYFVGCGISRLARYNVTAEALSGRTDASVDPGTAKVTHFEGLPIPTSLALVAMVAIFAALGRWQASLPLGALVLGPFTLHPPAVLYFLHGSGMVSKTLRIPKP